MRRLRLALLVLVPLTLPAPARADYFAVRLESHETFGDVATSVCTATAETSVPGFVAARTSVTCRLDETARTLQAAGPRAVSAVVAAVGPTFLACVSGSATFVSATGGRVHVVAEERCVVYDH